VHYYLFSKAGRGFSDRRDLMEMKVHHLALGARDVKRVATFYRDLLGLPEVCRHHEPGGALRSIWLDLGGPVLMIEQTEEPARHVQGIGAGPFLLALAAAPSERSVLECSLGASGFPVDSRTEHTIYFRDPEGNRVAISSCSLQKHSNDTKR
jgi:catechol 2,3-dioxygenase-like lactoylglutathione lyase family enzyme